MSNDNNLTIQILEKSWQVRCPEEKKHELQKCARLLDSKMHEIIENGKIMGTEQITVMAAINVIYDLLQQQSQKDLYIDSLSSRVRELQNKLAKHVPQNQQLEI